MAEFDTDSFLDDLRLVMRQRDKSQSRLAWETGISPATVSRILHRQQGLNTIDTAVTIADWMGVSLTDYLVQREAS